MPRMIYQIGRCVLNLNSWKRLTQKNKLGESVLSERAYEIILFSPLRKGISKALIISVCPFFFILLFFLLKKCEVNGLFGKMHELASSLNYCVIMYVFLENPIHLIFLLTFAKCNWFFPDVRKWFSVNIYISCCGLHEIMSHVNIRSR